MEAMSTIFWTIIAAVVRSFLSLRYQIEVKGMEKLTPENLNRKGGVLFIPNHTAHIDPLFNFLLLWPRFRMRPLVIEYIYRLPLMRRLHQLVRSLPIPNFEASVNEYKIRLGEKSIREIAEGLKKGDHFIVYPSGKLKSTAKELLAGASGAHELLKECPDANVVLIRTSGLWGSSFSSALTGKSPDLHKTLVRGFKVLLKNLFFFTPRRKIVIELEPNLEDFPREHVKRADLNRYLENWYNRYPDGSGNVVENEPLLLVSYNRWNKELPEVYVRKKNNEKAYDIPISKAIRSKIYGAIRDILDDPNREIQSEMSFAFDLGMDSLNIAEFITFLTKHYDVGEIHPEDLETVGKVLALAEGGAKSRTPKVFTSTYTWPKESEEKGRPDPALPLGQTIPEAFLNSCLRMGRYPACGDDTVGVLTYHRLKKIVLVLAQHFKTYKENRVAVLLPASAGAYIAILALQMAGKTPVMLNWTLGSRYLEEMMKISGAETIITSWKFLDRVSNVQFGDCLNKLVLLEDIRSSLTLSMKLRGLFLSRCSVSKVMHAMPLQDQDENTPCVILFTSGTEAAPKGVPLSHKNIIANQRSAMQCIDVRPTDVIYGILPPFHSFGFSVAGLFPLLGGVKVAFYPDPTDSFALAEGVHRWKVGLFCSAPAFLKGLFHAAKEEQLQTIRYFVSGAEKATPELYHRVTQLHNGAKLLEGYGITECSPILTLNRPHLPPKGVGRILPDIECITIHPETEELLKKGEDGEICVRGPNVFHGYLGHPRSPFIVLDGKEWYRTGDLGHLEEDGTLILSGRLKRFTKMGGEMLSLGGIEEVLLTYLIAQQRVSSDIPSLALCADEKEVGKPQLILFVTVDLSKEEANQILQDAGFSNLVKISLVKRIEEIPLMGAGKTNYRNLQDLC